jgi:hypothetical protein
MKTLLTLLLATLCAATGYGQTLKSLMYNTTNGNVVYSGTNNLTFGGVFFNGGVTFNEDVFANYLEIGSLQLQSGGIVFSGTNAAIAAATTRTNLGLGATNIVKFGSLEIATAYRFDPLQAEFYVPIWFGDSTNRFFAFESVENVAKAREDLQLGSTNNVAFRNIASGGNIVITNQSATNNGLLFIYRTNNEAFLGLANLIASNNTTISNETLFRVGTAEATNRAAQFGFRSTNTNGNGVAVFSVFGYNALMMIGPSDPAAGTNPIQATVYSVAPTNKVMTLITTNTGAMLMHRPIGIDTAGVLTNAPANTTNVAGWIQFYVGTNSVRVPYYQ